MAATATPDPATVGAAQPARQFIALAGPFAASTRISGLAGATILALEDRSVSAYLQVGASP